MSTRNARSAVAVGALLLSAGLLASACGQGRAATTQASAEVVSTDAVAAASATSTTTKGARGNGAVTVDGLSLPRKVGYTGLEFTLSKATPQTDENEGPGVVLDVTVRNTRDKDTVITSDWVSLVESDGTRRPATAIDNPEGGFGLLPIELPTGGKAQHLFFVPIKGSLRLADTRLSVSNKKGVPAEVPLSGSETTSPYPVGFAVPTAPMSFGGNAPMTVTLKSAQLAEEYQDLRADKGKHLVVLKIVVVGDPCNCGGAGAGTGTVRLVVDGTPRDAVRQDPGGCCLLGVGDTQELTEIYELPDAHTTVSMVAQGSLLADRREQHPFAVTVPPLPAGAVPATGAATTSTTRPGS